MQPFLQLCLTVLCAFAVGLIFQRLHVPGGMMVGAVIGSCILSCATSAAYMPGTAKTIAQIIAGAFIGSGIRREDLSAMKQVIKPALILLPCLLAVNLLAGYVVYRISSLDLLTALLACAPGGMSDIPMIAADLGADASVVVVMQFIRMSVGIGVFPLMIHAAAGAHTKPGSCPPPSPPKKTCYHPRHVLLTLAVAAGFGIIGKMSPVPSGTMGFATIGCVLFSCLSNRAEMPPILRRAAQLLSGAYVGSSMGIQQLAVLKTLGLPVLVLVSAYILACFGTGALLYRAGCFRYKEAMLASTPAGASDMALISADLGIDNVQIIVLQVLRLLAVVLFFPSILSGAVHLLAG